MRNPPRGARLEFHNLTIHKHTWYDKDIRHGEQTVTVHRYDMRDVHGNKYVYSGVSLGYKVGAVIDIKGTVKKEKDRFGFTRLFVVKVLGSSRKGFL